LLLPAKAPIFENQSNEMVFLIILYLVLAIGVAFLGQNRKIGFAQSFGLSLFLTPIIGLAFVAHSDKKITYFEYQYHCPRCGYNFTEELEHCPYCIKNGHQIVLQKEEVTTT
jgi:DNA-directed RNA polymerase subunit RPC12/RpoP